MTNQTLHRGIALLNETRFYEAHEVLEDAWRESAGEVKRFRQALVQIAVALHHYSTGNLRGARSVLARATRNLAPFDQGFEGLDLDDLKQQLAMWSDAIHSGVSCTQPLRVRWIS